MGRQPKQNKLPKTSISVSQNLWEILSQKKPSRNTMDQFLTKIVAEWIDYAENFPFLEDSYNKATKKNDEYCRRISELEGRLTAALGLGNKVEPPRGVAAKSYCPPGINLALSPNPADNMATNLPPKNIEEVTEKV